MIINAWIPKIRGLSLLSHLVQITEVLAALAREGWEKQLVIFVS